MFVGGMYPDMWRPASPDRSDIASRSPTNMVPPETGSYGHLSTTGYDTSDGYPNVQPFSHSYRDFPVFKEKPAHDVTNALLSLKNAVVHPTFGGQISPISSTMHIGPLTPSAPSGTTQQPQSYSMNPSGAQIHHPMSYGGRASPQYQVVPGVHAQLHGDPMNTHPTAQQPGANLFPAMSVNVSMSMNVVPPNFGATSCNPSQQWQATPQNYGMSDAEYQHIPQESPFQASYSPYPQNYYTPHYSLSPEFRSTVPENRSLYYKMGDELKSSARYYPGNQYKRGKFIDERPFQMPHSPDHSKINLCRICGKTYARPSTLKTHLRTHSGEKPYKCNACNKSFSQAANLTAHARTHSGEKPFHCPVCDRHFSQSSSVTTHMRTHSGERPYRCRLCKKAFSDSSTLTKHLRIHSGEKPYQCKLCLLRFSQSGNLNRHMRVHTNSG